MTFNGESYAECTVHFIQKAKECIEHQNPYKAYSWLDSAEEDAKMLLGWFQREEKYLPVWDDQQKTWIRPEFVEGDEE